MALWKPFRGTSAALANVPKTDGHAYFCTDDGSLFFDYKDENNELHRKQITAKELTPVNFLAEPITVETVVDEELHEIQSLGLVAGKSYKMSGTYGSSNIPFEFTDKAGSDGEFVLFANNSSAIDGVLMVGIMESTEGSFMMLGAQDPSDIDKVGEFSPLVINSIAEAQPEYATKESVDNLSEQANSIDERVTALEKGDEPVNLLSEPITIETWTSQEMPYEGASLGVVIDKTYKISGTMGSDNSPWSFTTTAIGSESVGLEAGAALLAQEDPINQAAIAIYDRLSLATGAPVIDSSKCYMVLGCTNASDTNQPFTINSVIEAQVEYATKEEVETLDGRVTALEKEYEEYEPLVTLTTAHAVDSTYRIANVTNSNFLSTPFKAGDCFKVNLKVNDQVYEGWVVGANDSTGIITSKNPMGSYGDSGFSVLADGTAGYFGYVLPSAAAGEASLSDLVPVCVTLNAEVSYSSGGEPVVTPKIGSIAIFSMFGNSAADSDPVQLKIYVSKSTVLADPMTLAGQAFVFNYNGDANISMVTPEKTSLVNFGDGGVEYYPSENTILIHSYAPSDFGVKPNALYIYGDIKHLPNNFLKGAACLTSFELTKARTFGESAFENCVNLVCAVMHPETTTISKSAFKGCTSLKCIDLRGVTTIAESAFENCSALTSITLPDSLRQIEANAFKGTGLTTVIIPAGVTTIADTAFDSTTKLITASELSYLDGVTSNIQAQLNTALAGKTYTLPAAGASLGGVKSGGDVTIADGVITVSDDSHNHVISNIDGLQTALDGKANSSHGTHVTYGGNGSATTVSRSDHTHSYLEKTTYEKSAELACGSNGLVCLGKFGAYDTNITIELNSTTSKTYHATIVIWSQNVVANGTAGGVGCYVYDDADNQITPLLSVFRPYGSASRQIEVYANLPGWSKNLVHIQGVALSDGGMTDVLTSVSSIPTSIDGKIKVTPVNVLTTNFAASSHTHAEIPTLSYNSTTKTLTIS